MENRKIDAFVDAERKESKEDVCLTIMANPIIEEEKLGKQLGGMKQNLVPKNS